MPAHALEGRFSAFGPGRASLASTISGSVKPASNAALEPARISSPLLLKTSSISLPASSLQKPSQ
jgi:hypothetical protein